VVVKAVAVKAPVKPVVKAVRLDIKKIANKLKRKIKLWENE